MIFILPNRIAIKIKLSKILHVLSCWHPVLPWRQQCRFTVACGRLVSKKLPLETWEWFSVQNNTHARSKKLFPPLYWCWGCFHGVGRGHASIVFWLCACVVWICSVAQMLSCAFCAAGCLGFRFSSAWRSCHPSSFVFAAKMWRAETRVTQQLNTVL